MTTTMNMTGNTIPADQLDLMNRLAEHKRALRNELARDIACGLASSGRAFKPQVLANIAVETADALIDLLTTREGREGPGLREGA